MTTGRINQVAFLTDAAVVRGRRTRRIRRPATTGDSRSFRAIDFVSGKRGSVGTTTPSLTVEIFRIREIVGSPWAWTTARVRARAGTRTCRFEVHPTTRTQVRGHRKANFVHFRHFRIPLRRYATQETRKRTVEAGNALVPTNEGASKAGSRRTSGDPTNPY